jgi:hypothetical protein
MLKFRKYKGLRYYGLFLLILLMGQVTADLLGYSIFRTTKTYQEKTAGPNYYHK